jgi:hypothetical protein
MKHFFLTAIFLASFCSWAQNTVNATSTFQSPSPVINAITIWKDTSLHDWAGTVMRAQLSVVAPVAGAIVGVVKFTYVPEDKLVAIAIKQSSSDFTISGQISDFTDEEGRRIVSLTSGHALEIQMPVNVPYPNAGQALLKDFMVEVEPTEYLGTQ